MAAHSRKLPAELRRKLSAHGRALLHEGLGGSAAPPPASAFEPDPAATARWVSRHSGDYVAYLVPRRLGMLNGGMAYAAAYRRAHPELPPDAPVPTPTEYVVRAASESEPTSRVLARASVAVRGGRVAAVAVDALRAPWADALRALLASLAGAAQRDEWDAAEKRRREQWEDAPPRRANQKPSKQATAALLAEGLSAAAPKRKPAAAANAARARPRPSGFGTL